MGGEIHEPLSEDAHRMGLLRPCLRQIETSFEHPTLEPSPPSTDLGHDFRMAYAQQPQEFEFIHRGDFGQMLSFPSNLPMAISPLIYPSSR